jgi:hypothetical protein
VAGAAARLEDIIAIERLRVKVSVTAAVARVVRLGASAAILMLARSIAVLGNSGRRAGLDRRRCGRLGRIATGSLDALLSAFL